MEKKHVLITRFNIHYKTKMAEKGFDTEVWLDDRFEIFKKYCFPSIINQSKKDFNWFIYADSETTPRVLSELKDLIKPYPHITLIVRVFDNFSVRPYLKEDIQTYLGGDFDFLISSRVDTDDMLHKDYIKLVQSYFNFQEYEALNFNKGIVYDIQTGVTAIKIHKSNAFLSLIEKRNEGSFKTVFYQMHINFKNEPAKREIKIKAPMWCVTVHGLNVSTGFYGEIFKFSKPNLAKMFGFKFQKKPSILNITKFTLRSYKRTLLKLADKIRIF